MSRTTCRAISQGKVRGSVAGLLLTTEAMITEKPVEAAAGAPMPDMGAMGGMGGMM